jgi:NTE family protein
MGQVGTFPPDEATVTTAFALSGGGNLGPMQAGAVAALLEDGIEPDLLIGTSVGALNAAFLATRPGKKGARALIDGWSSLQRREVAAFSPIALLAGFVGMKDHLLRANRLRTLMRRWVEIDRIEDAGIPLAVVTTDALSGEAVVLQTGDLVDALCASAAIPGLLPPVRIGERWLIDGSLAAGCPVLQAQALGAHDVYMITTATAPRLRPPRGAIGMAMNSVSLVTARSNQEQLAAARLNAASIGGHVFVVPTGQPPAPSTFDLSKGATLATVAYNAARSWLYSELVTSLGSDDDTSSHRV